MDVGVRMPRFAAARRTEKAYRHDRITIRQQHPPTPAATQPLRRLPTRPSGPAGLQSSLVLGLVPLAISFDTDNHSSLPMFSVWNFDLRRKNGITFGRSLGNSAAKRVSIAARV